MRMTHILFLGIAPLNNPFLIKKVLLTNTEYIKNEKHETEIWNKVVFQLNKFCQSARTQNPHNNDSKSRFE